MIGTQLLAPRNCKLQKIVRINQAEDYADDKRESPT